MPQTLTPLVFEIRPMYEFYKTVNCFAQIRPGLVLACYVVRTLALMEKEMKPWLLMNNETDVEIS